MVRSVRKKEETFLPEALQLAESTNEALKAG